MQSRIPSLSICIVIEDETEAQRLRAMELSQELGLTITDALSAEQFPYQLRITTQGLELLVAHAQGKSRILADFVKGAMGYRRKHGGGRQQAIAKAVGIKGVKDGLTVLDATAGLGRDGFVLASLGCQVHLVERSPIIAILLKDGLARAGQEPFLSKILERISVSVGDALQILTTIQPHSIEAPEVVYLDPMFPEENKTALKTLDLRVIRDIVGPDFDAESLFRMALKVAKKRVVVKRPIQAPTISDIKPSFSLVGKRNRYDVYIHI